MDDNVLSSPAYKFLPSINSPADLRALDASDLPQVCAEVREFIVDTITQVGGHFGGGLGAVEITTALHYVFNTPKDKIVIDTGHQGYPHKILTGRRDRLASIRKKGGLSGFLKRDESEYDVFGAGHASTSISAALGLAVARDYRGEDFHVAAVIGDGAMTGGLAYEAMNNCGIQNRRMIVILNDNNMSIDPNVWSISNYFTGLATSNTVQRVRRNVWELAGRTGEVGDRIRRLLGRIEDGMKAVLTPGMLFEALGFDYFGPVNGHNVKQLVETLEFVKKNINGPVLLHVTTQKGKGYKPAEKHVQFLHAIGQPVDKITGKALAAPNPVAKPPKYERVFGESMIDLCRRNDRVVAITAAMPSGTGLIELQKVMPERVIDVGIAEGHAVTFAAGMAAEGMTPVCAIYSSFLQRAFDNVVHDCALQRLHVVFCLDRSGLVGADGPTHHGVLDFAYLRIIQGMVVMAPKDEAELRDMLYTATCVYKDGPISIRYPRGTGIGVEMGEYKAIPIGKSEVLREGGEVAILAIGNRVYPALEAAAALEAEGISTGVVNARFVKPLDTDMIDEICRKYDKIVTVEDHQKQGGFGSAVLEYIAESNVRGVEVKVHGLEDMYIDHGTQAELWRETRLDAAGIASVVREVLGVPYEMNALMPEK